MNRYIAILLMAFSGSAFADSYLCIGEAGAGVVFGNGIKTISRGYEMSDEKFILSNKSGKWQVSIFGGDSPMPFECAAEGRVINCSHPDEPGLGFFTFFNDGTFVHLYYWPVDGRSEEKGTEMITMAGKCSKI